MATEPSENPPLTTGEESNVFSELKQRTRPRYPKSAGLIVLGCGISLVLGSFLVPRGRSARGADDFDLKDAKYLGAERCSKCHEKPGPKDRTDHVLLTEYATWKTHDKHSQAYEILKQERAQRMGRLLGVDVLREDKDNACLNCHAMNFPKERRGALFNIADGVSCDGCHGPARSWLADHSEPDWRDKTPAEKARLGMLDVRDPVRRAEMCLSCHVGNAAEGKVVTHAMYAAGHPPLPGFEIDTFSENLPYHWRYLKDKPPEIQKKFGYDPAALERVRNVAAGGVTALREAMRLTAAQARAPGWPDFAQFDCAACHHELRRPSWRQERGFGAAPGRPAAPAWPSALVKLGIFASAANDAEVKTWLGQLEQKKQKLDDAFAARPFGDPARIALAASDFAAWADGLLGQLRAVKIDRAAALRLLRQIVSLVQTDHPDYESARQLAWAFRSIHAQLDPKLERNADIQTILDALGKDLNLSLAAGREKKIMDALPLRLQAQERYQPDKLRKNFEALGKLLGGK